jgi:hypothetical protein
MRPGPRCFLAFVIMVGACSTPPSATSGPESLVPASTPASPSAPTAAPTPAATPAASVPASAEPVLSWSRLDPAGSAPREREDHTWTIDPATGQAYLFGGRDAARVLGDLWRYDLHADTWTRIKTQGAAPAPRFGHTGTWVPGIGLVVWSGQAGSDFFSDTWAFDPSAGRWRRLAANGPAPKARYGSCAALGPDDRLWISHGFTEDTGRFSDTWAYDFSARRWSDETPNGRVATIRCLHDCLWTNDGRFLIYAGQTTGAPAIGDLWARGLESGWSRIPDVQPPARQLYALAIVGSGQGSERAFVFGGGDEDRAKLADLWSLDLDALTWRKESPTGRAPSGRSGAAMVTDPSGGRVLLFGGQTRSGTLGDLWELSLAD